MGWFRKSRDQSDDDSDRPAEKEKSRKPPESAFRQQRLAALMPILTARTVIPIFFVVGILFGPLGGGMLYASSRVAAAMQY
jgi:hypothetical protein